MKTTLKVLALVLVVVLGAVIFAGCSQEEESIVIYQNKVEIHEQLSAFAALYEEETGVKVEVKTAGGDTPYAENLKAEFQSDRQPDIFVIEGMGGYNTWSDKLAPFEDEEWMDVTTLEFVVDGVTYGFPVAVDAMKDELGIDSVVAMAAGPDMYWVTGLHNFNGYLSAGLPYGDTTVLDELNAGVADMERLTEYADWVELLFEYADPTVLTTGNYDAQVGQFGNQKAAFIHQGNWIDPGLISNGVDFEMGYAPHASVYGEHNAIFIGAPSFYVLNNESENLDAAKAFLNYMAMNENGHEYMVNEANMLPAFTNVTLVPSSPLTSSVFEWLKVEDGAYTWLQNDMPDGFGMGTLGPIYESFAKGDLTKDEFITKVAEAIESIG